MEYQSASLTAFLKIGFDGGGDGEGIRRENNFSVVGA